ncbi:MAG: zf-TFIIB domain-containing protein [Candidatus Omnitrophica bacterium]|nr:zf-TFIIB domain-containing protein [Candidatus Omnitrophota bacterium]
MSEADKQVNLDCPKCLGKLQKQQVEHIELDVCFVCEGIWFDAGELEAVIKADSKDFKYIDVGREAFDGKEAIAAGLVLDKEKGKCPICNDGTELVRTVYKPKPEFNIDLCPKGHGVWLDGGEIQMIRKRGLAKIHDIFEHLGDVIKYAFSKEGFKDLIHSKRRRGL